MNKGKLKFKLEYFLVGLGITILTCYFSFSFSIGVDAVEFNNIEALASEEEIDPRDYCKQAGGLCFLPELIVMGLQLEDKVE